MWILLIIVVLSLFYFVRLIKKKFNTEKDNIIVVLQGSIYILLSLAVMFRIWILYISAIILIGILALRPEGIMKYLENKFQILKKVI